jgi:PmbA protein
VEQIAEQIIKKAQKENVDAVVNITNQKTLSLEYNRDKYNGSSEGVISLLELRLSKNRKYAYTTTTLPNNWSRCFEMAMKILKISRPLKHDIPLAEPKKLKNAEGTFSRKVDEMPFEEMFQKSKDAVSEAKNMHKDISLPDAKFTKETEHFLAANSNGIMAFDNTTMLSGMTVCCIGTSTGVEGRTSHSDVDFVPFAKKSAQMCIDSLNPKPVKTGKMDLILSQYATADLLQAALVPAFMADNVQNKRSFLRGKIGKKVFSDKVSIYDDGTLKNGLGTGNADLEGAPSQRTELVRKGVLKSYLYDAYSALIDKKKSTSSCSSIARIPSIGISNFILEHGNYSREEMIKETKHGIFSEFVMGTHLVNSITGDASIGLSNAFYVENGEIKYPVKQAMISLNIFDALKKIVVIGKDMRQESAIMCPSIKLEGVQIVA